VEGTLSVGFIATMTIGMAITYTIPAIFLAAVVALQYIALRIRREGLDVQLARAAEAAAGTACRARGPRAARARARGRRRGGARGRARGRPRRPGRGDRAPVGPRGARRP